MSRRLTRRVAPSTRGRAAPEPFGSGAVYRNASMSRPAAAPLPAEETTRLTDFARACKAAARVVALYPATHPAIQSSLGRIAESAGGLVARGPARLAVLPDGLLLNNQAPGRSDSAVQELATMLHGHLIGEMTLVGEMGPAAWHTFLGLLARSPEDIRSQGGIVRAWMAAGGGPIELRQIDYGDVLRERKGALAGDWDEIVTSYLEGEFSISTTRRWRRCSTSPATRRASGISPSGWSRRRKRAASASRRIWSC